MIDRCRMTIVPFVVVTAAIAGCQNDELSSDVASSPPMAHSTSSSEFPDEWYFYGEKRPASLRGLEGKPAPALTTKHWIGTPQNLADLKGKVVIVDFWGTWCPPCMRSLPHNVELADRYKNKGLVFIGVHDSKRGFERMAAVAKDKKINYPLAVDDSSKSEKAYFVSFWPTYVAIDKKGIVRAAGLEPNSVENVIKKLIDEKE